jgi:hypothetical protein
MAIYSEKQFLAYEIAKELNDIQHFGWYCILLERFSTALIFGILRDLQGIKNWPKIKNKGAYFTATFFKYVKNKNISD